MGERQTTAREQNKQRTREALLRAGMELFMEQGVDLPSLDSICARAGFTRGAFYVHFTDRADFLSAVVNQALEDFINSVIVRDEQGHDLRKIMGLFVDAATRGAVPLMGDQSQKVRILLEARARNPEIHGRFAALLAMAIERLAAAIQDDQASGNVRQGLDPQHLAMLLMSIAVGLIVFIEMEVVLDIPGMLKMADNLILKRPDRPAGT